jgi:hypothetical protein
MTDVPGWCTPGRLASWPPMSTDRQARAELWASSEHLRNRISAYRDQPHAIDDAVLATDDGSLSVEAVIIRAYRLLGHLVYAPGSPLEADQELGEAFRQQEEELVDFYWSALTAVEAYREVLVAYRALKYGCALAQRGGLERIRRDKRVQLEERNACLEALTDFHRKFSAMLVVLNPVPLP